MKFKHALNLLFISLLSLLQSQRGFAQLQPSLWFLSQDTSWKQSGSILLAHGNGMVGGSQADMWMFNKLVRGGHMSNERLARLDDRGTYLNRAGALANGGIELYNIQDSIFKHPQWGLKVQVNSNYHASLNYTSDLFHAVFRGNGDRPGDTLSLGPMSAQYQAWQKFGIGIFNKNTLSGVTLSLVAGEKYQSLLVSQADLFTSSNGDSLALSYQGDYWRSDTLKRGWANGSGIGAAIDADFNIPLEGNGGWINIGLRDFGFAVWNKNAQHFTFDSLTTWQGLQTESILDLSTDTLGFPNLEDSVHYFKRQERFTAMLPFSIHFRFSRYFTKTDSYEFGMSIWPNRAAIPLVFVGMNHKISEHFMFSERFSYGGYGTWGIGAEMQWMPKGQWLFALSTNHLGGFTMGSAHSRDVRFTVGRMLKVVNNDREITE